MPEFKVTRYRIRTDGNYGTLQQPFSAVFLSDLHNVSYGENNRRLLQAIRQANPSLILVGGDMVIECGEQPQSDAALALFDELTRKYPVYCANGNHEARLKYGEEEKRAQYEQYRSKIGSLGVLMAENSSFGVRICGMNLRIWGLEIPMECYGRSSRYRLEQDEIETLLGKPDADAYNILLAHHPVYFDTYAAWGAQLTLSGHLHGGIVRLPFLGGVISPQVQLFPKYDKGLFEQDGRKMIISGGLGSHTIPIRINNPPEMVVIDFY